MVTHYIRKRSVIKMCRKCGAVEPHVRFYHGSRVCQPCSVQRALAYRRTHPDGARLQRQRRYARHKTRLNRYRSDQYRRRLGLDPADPSYLARVAQRALLRANWQGLSPEERRLHTQRLKTLHAHHRRARLRSLPAAYPPAAWRDALDYWHSCCAVCGEIPGLFWMLVPDHWIPLASPDCPGTVPWNIVPLCNGTTGCNNRKGGKPPHAWLIATFGQSKGTTILRRIQRFLHQMATIYMG